MRKAAFLVSVIVPLALGGAPRAWAAGEAEDTTCIIKPRVTVQLGSPIAGLLAATLVDRGDSVTKGQVVAQLESSVDQATLALDRLKAANDTAEKVEQADKELSQREMERKQFLVDQKIANLNSLDELQTKVREGELRVQQAQMDRKVAELTAERSTRELALKSIRSPIDGVVIERKLSAGEYIYEQNVHHDAGADRSAERGTGGAGRGATAASRLAWSPRCIPARRSAARIRRRWRWSIPSSMRRAAPSACV